MWSLTYFLCVIACTLTDESQMCMFSKDFCHFFLFSLYRLKTYLHLSASELHIGSRQLLSLSSRRRNDVSLLGQLIQESKGIFTRLQDSISCILAGNVHRIAGVFMYLLIYLFIYTVEQVLSEICNKSYQNILFKTH